MTLLAWAGLGAGIFALWIASIGSGSVEDVVFSMLLGIVVFSMLLGIAAFGFFLGWLAWGAP